MLDALRRTGVATFPGWLEPDRIGELREEIGLYLSGEIDAELPQGAVRSQASAIDMPHVNGPAVRRLAGDARVRAVLAEVPGVRSGSVSLLSSIYYVKRPGHRGQPWHQDAFFAPQGFTRVITCWFALDPADEAKGCLRVTSQPAARLLPTSYTSDGSEHVLTHEITAEALGDLATSEHLLEVETGTMLVLDGLLPHRSMRNRGARSRRAVVLQFGWASATPGEAAPTEPTARTSLRFDASIQTS